MNEYMLDTKDWSREDFIRIVGSIFECSPWIAEEAWRSRPFSSKEQMFETMMKIVNLAGEEKQVKLLNAHPELGAKIRMTPESLVEQQSAGLDRLERDEAYIFQRMNLAYREQFGFPFIIAVRGLTADMIADSMQKRMKSDRQTELHNALQEVFKIASFRLEHLDWEVGTEAT
ncbi:2-oxo-4-hydroxy-4-carboxy-5-ureidoimidazoline decarboxylase [Paenibacillus sp. HB172176]|uniref:2-oxo-4-hydroxy-4-carboxy-5-ureidoimidazoline decarboxylase n=1 Tax=Paenibacillus sp. HB172176 TaxID=2493690 RepID=UPI001438A4E8|nr:2-oxo-4-hydroxy-4-carboxy-5-ureidoimidazoline decarboxylase [Paenibacillus sp. HB172176]